MTESSYFLLNANISPTALHPKGTARRFVFNPVTVLKELLQAHKSDTLVGYAIAKAATDPATNWPEVIRQLASQANDNPQGMADVLGSFTVNLLLVVHGCEMIPPPAKG